MQDNSMIVPILNIMCDCASRKISVKLKASTGLSVYEGRLVSMKLEFCVTFPAIKRKHK